MLYNIHMTNLISISQARTKLPTLIENISNKLDRALITVNNKPKAIIISMEELESLEETAEILSIPNAQKSIKKGLSELGKRKGIKLSKLLGA